MQWCSSNQQTAYAIGFGCRFGLHYHPDSEGIYIAEYLFIVLSVCPFMSLFISEAHHVLHSLVHLLRQTMSCWDDSRGIYHALRTFYYLYRN
jgi:hypothetical protein